MIKPRYNYGEELYLKSDIEQRMRVVSGFIHRPGNIMYLLMCGQDESAHYDFELSEDRNIVMVTSN
jgi:hypothetical protein